jgi:hypothetical protein
MPSPAQQHVKKDPVRRTANFTESSHATTDVVSTCNVSPAASVFVVMTPIAPMNAMPSPLMTWRIRPWPPQQHVRGFVSTSYETVTSPMDAKYARSLPRKRRPLRFRGRTFAGRTGVSPTYAPGPVASNVPMMHGEPERHRAQQSSPLHPALVAECA